MKYTLFALLLLASISGRGQTDSLGRDSSLIFIGSLPFNSGYCPATGIYFWSNSFEDKHLYDSGKVQIIGDTIAAIRLLAKQCDSITRKYWDLQQYFNDVVIAADSAIVTIPQPEIRGGKIVDVNYEKRLRRVDAYVQAINRYRNFVYNIHQNKKRKK